MKTSEILDKAADVIERNGWYQTDWYCVGEKERPEDCRVCAGGAINIAAGHDPDLESDDEGTLDDERRAAYVALATRVEPVLLADIRDGFPLSVETLINTVAGWNDELVQSAEQVVAELRAAAESERREGR